MPRSVNHVASRAKEKENLETHPWVITAATAMCTVAKNTWEKGLTYAYRDRKQKNAISAHF